VCLYWGQWLQGHYSLQGGHLYLGLLHLLLHISDVLK
jgi:hypothetical protein